MDGVAWLPTALLAEFASAMPNSLEREVECPMSTDNRTGIPGIVRNGVVVPQTDAELPDGAHVEIILEPKAMSRELQLELATWERASDDAWKMIDQWEADES
jgi:hypothetical protein